MTKRDKMIRSYLRWEQRQSQFERHQHRYNYRNTDTYYEIPCHLLKNYDDGAILRKNLEYGR